MNAHPIVMVATMGRPMLHCSGELTEIDDRLVCTRGLACLVEELIRKQPGGVSTRTSIRAAHGPRRDPAT